MKNGICKELCIELTDLCHQNCVHCSSSSTLNASSCHSLEAAQVEKLIAWFSSQGGELLELSGGDPLLYPALRSILRVAADRDIRVRIYTTGYDLAAPNVPSLAELHALGVRELVFSLQGSCAALHEEVTCSPGSFDRTVQAIRDARQLGFWVGVHFVPMTVNVDSLEDTYRLAETLGVNEFAVLRFVAQGRGAENQWLEIDETRFEALVRRLAELVPESSKTKMRAGCPLNFCSLYSSSIEPKRCDAGKTTALVDPRGVMYPCPAFKNIDKAIGVGPSDDWQALWESAQWNELRELQPESLSGECAECGRRDRCSGRCAAQRYLAHGSVLVGPDPMCPLSTRRSSTAQPHQRTA